MKPVRAAVFLLSCACAALADLTEVEPGLRLIGIHEMDTESREIAAALATSPNLILDLRDARGSMQAAVQLEALLAQSKQGTTRYLLLNGDTSTAVTARLPFTGPGLVVLAPAQDKLRVDVPVSTSVADDRAAVNALRAGANPLTLLQSSEPKRRDDEAALSAAPAAEPPQTPTPHASKSTPTDIVLSRAVQIHHGWTAIRANL
ncbi:MAG: hypothetical protein SFV32_11465 [Opitutaceae bacterium]|nr:hypothetical protein [Opitutaceae bacterium]